MMCEARLFVVRWIGNELPYAITGKQTDVVSTDAACRMERNNVGRTQPERRGLSGVEIYSTDLRYGFAPQ